MEITDLELMDRYQTVFDQYIDMAPKLAKHLEQFGRIRKELQNLVVEVRKRKLPEREDAQTDT